MEIIIDGKKYKLVEIKEEENEEETSEDDWIIPKGWVRYGNLVIQEETSEKGYTWIEANELKATVHLKKNGENKTFVARLLSKEQLEELSEEERTSDNWYWTNTAIDSKCHWYVDFNGNLNYGYDKFNYGGSARLGFELTD